MPAIYTPLNNVPMSIHIYKPPPSKHRNNGTISRKK